MNLIEQLGGYEAAKEMYLAQLKAGLAPYGYEDTLLEYRREHNIFEVGDSVLTNDPASNGRVYKIIFKRGEHYKLQSDTGVRYCREWRIDRHATDEEIANNARSK